MSLSKLTDNLNNISSLPDKPNLQSDELKATFDKTGNIIKKYINEILTEEIDKILIKKVDKVTGKVLSSNDYTDEEKKKLNGTEVVDRLDSDSKTDSLSANQGKILNEKVTQRIYKKVFTESANELNIDLEKEGFSFEPGDTIELQFVGNLSNTEEREYNNLILLPNGTENYSVKRGSFFENAAGNMSIVNKENVMPRIARGSDYKIIANSTIVYDRKGYIVIQCNFSCITGQLNSQIGQMSFVLGQVTNVKSFKIKGLDPTTIGEGSQLIIYKR